MGKGQQVNPFGIGGAFVQYCLDQGILHLEMDKNHEIKYYLKKILVLFYQNVPK